MGIPEKTVSLDDIFYVTRVYHCDIGNGKWGEHEIVYILIMQLDFTVKANSNELTEISFVPEGRLNEHVATFKAPLEPVFKLIYKNMLHLWWKNLDDLNSIKNHNDILRFDKCK